MSDFESVAKEYYEADMGFGIGPQFMALLFDTLFAGVLICQSTHWLPNWKTDPAHIRGIVAFGVLAALGTTVFTWTNYFASFVTNFGHYSRFASLSILGWYALLDLLTVIPVQLVFGERSIKINNKNPLVVILDGLLILGTMVAAIGVIVTTRNRSIFDTSMVMHAFLILWPTVCTCAHLTLTSTIIFGLIKSRTGSRHVTRIVDRIIYTSLESQLPATAFALAAMILIASNPKSPIIAWIVIVHPKVFMIGCLAMINTRHTWQRTGKVPSAIVPHDTRTSSLANSSYAPESSWPTAEGPTTPRQARHMSAHRNASLDEIDYAESGFGKKSFVDSEEIVSVPMQSFSPSASIVDVPQRSSRGLEGEFGVSKDSLADPTVGRANQIRG